jgi:hypothetical protein
MLSRTLLQALVLVMIASAAFAKDKSTKIEIVLDQNLGSDVSQTGEAFTGTLNKPVSLPSGAVLAKGCTLTGRVLHAESTENYTRAGDLELVLTSIYSEGKNYLVHSNTLVLMGKMMREDRGAARREDASRAATGVIFGNPGANSGTISGTNVSVSPSSQIAGKQVLVPARSKLSFTATIPD